MGNSKKTSEIDALQTRYLEVLSEMYPSIRLGVHGDHQPSGNFKSAERDRTCAQ